MKDRAKIKNISRMVIKIGTSTLTHSGGKLNFDRFEKLARVISDLMNSGKEIVLVSSGAIAVGATIVNRTSKPGTLAEKQALAAIGQAELMKIYQKFFGEYNQHVAQILLTKDEMTHKTKSKNARNTLDTLLEMNVLPVINENDTVATDEIEYGDNDRLSADVAALIDAELLVILSDIDGLYSADPRKDKNAVIINKVEKITPAIEKMASGAGSIFAKGGMATKIAAAKICGLAGIPTIIMNGQEPKQITQLLAGENIGTLFLSK